MEEQATRDAGLLGDVLDRELVQRPSGEHLNAQFDQLGAPSLRIQADALLAAHGDDRTLLNVSQLAIDRRSMRIYRRRMTQTTMRPRAATRHLGVLIVGSGFAGLGAAIRLAQDGRADFLVLERGSTSAAPGATTPIPGAACDVPSHLYSFSFAPQPGLARVVLAAAGDPGLPRARRRASTACCDKHLFDTRSPRRAGTPPRSAGASTTTGGDVHAPTLSSRRRRALRAARCPTSRASTVRRRALPLRALGPRRRPRRQAGRA